MSQGEVLGGSQCHFQFLLYLRQLVHWFNGKEWGELGQNCFIYSETAVVFCWLPVYDRVTAAELCILIFRIHRILMLCSACKILGKEIFFPEPTTFKTQCKRSCNVLQKSPQTFGPKLNSKKYLMWTLQIFKIKSVS